MKGWKKVALGAVITHYQEYIQAPEPREYRKLSVKLYGKGAILDTPANGAALKMQRHQIAKAGQVILSEIWGKRGAIGFVPHDGEGALCTSHFFLFDVHEEMVDRRWLDAIFRANYLQEQLDRDAKGTTGYAAVRPKNFLVCNIPLPPLAEQRRIVARIEEVATRVRNIESVRNGQNLEVVSLLQGAFRKITDGVERRAMRDVAPLVRRPIEVSAVSDYPELGVRSFGKGTFHKPSVSGLELGSKRVFMIEPGDLIFSNVFAWEGAIAVAKPEDKGRVGSHRFITRIPVQHLATAGFLCFYFLTPDGMEVINAASPGGAGRNRTLGLEALDGIKVPVPPLSEQIWFDKLCVEVKGMRELQRVSKLELDALLPAILDRAFKGEL